jgi:glycosyl transferase family 25
MDYQFYYGADKNEFTVETAEKENIYNESLARDHHRFSKQMKHGEIACSWSHRMIYEDMLAGNAQRILVFEDDAVPDYEQLKKIPRVLEEIPGNCGLLMWGWDKNGHAPLASGVKKWIYHLKHSSGTLKWDHTMIRNLYARPFSPHLKKAGFHDYTYAYAINRQAAAKLISMQTPIQYIADNLLAHAATKELLESFITWPKIFLHDAHPDGSQKNSYIR